MADDTTGWDASPVPAEYADLLEFREAVYQLTGVRTDREVLSWICEAKRLIPPSDEP